MNEDLIGKLIWFKPIIGYEEAYSIPAFPNFDVPCSILSVEVEMSILNVFNVLQGDSVFRLSAFEFVDEHGKRFD